MNEEWNLKVGDWVKLKPAHRHSAAYWKINPDHPHQIREIAPADTDYDCYWLIDTTGALAAYYGGFLDLIEAGGPW